MREVFDMAVRVKRIGWIACLTLLISAGAARADLPLQALNPFRGGGVALQPGYPAYNLPVNLFRGSEFINNPNYINSPQGGPLFDNNIFRQRLQRNVLGGGWTFEEFRFFGPDSYDNSNTLDFGAIKVQLGRDPTVVGSPQPVGVHNKIGYTTTLIPEVFFGSQTGQRNFDIFSGQTSFVPTPINYTVSINTGIQDFEWTGNAILNSAGRVNILGFYDFNLQFVNVGSYTADGIFVTDEQVTDLDTGQVRLSGNLLMDGIASLFQAYGGPLGEANTIFPRILSGAAQRPKRVDDLMSRIQAGEDLSDEEMQYLLQQMFMAAFKADPLGVMRNGMPETVPGFEGLSLSASAGETTNGTDPAAIAASNALFGQAGSPQATPEPGTLVLVAALWGLAGAARPALRSRRRNAGPAAC